MPVYLGVAIVVAAAAAVLVRLGLALLKYRGKRVIQCPESMRPAGVVVNSLHAAVTAFGKVELRLSQCSRWPERAGCGQECLSQIEASPEECLVRNIVANWYRGKACAACGQVFGEIDWAGSQPGLLMDSGMTLGWQQVPAEKLEETLSSAKAICFACHTARTLVREHPELAMDRHRAAPTHV